MRAASGYARAARRWPLRSRATAAAVARLARRRPIVWDPHPNGETPLAGARLVTPNQRELLRFAASSAERETDTGIGALTVAARQMREQWRAHAVAATLGAR